MITALNGKMPTSLLTIADTGANGPQSLSIDAAASWARMLAAGMPAGCLRSGYRTLAQQSAQDPRLALPAGQSEHGEGIAADVDEPARSWIAAHGLPYGWRIGFVPGEPWHAQYDQPDQHANDPAPQEDDMFSDQDRYALNLLLGSQGRVEQGVYALNHAAPPDPAAIAALVLAGLAPDKIAAAIPADLAKAVADEIAKRLAQ